MPIVIAICIKGSGGKFGDRIMGGYKMDDFLTDCQNKFRKRQKEEDRSLFPWSE